MCNKPTSKDQISKAFLLFGMCQSSSRASNGLQAVLTPKLCQIKTDYVQCEESSLIYQSSERSLGSLSSTHTRGVANKFQKVSESSGYIGYTLVYSGAHKQQGA